MGRRSHNHTISSSIIGSTTNKLDPALYDQIKLIAKNKGVSVHTLLEIWFARIIQEYKNGAF